MSIQGGLGVLRRANNPRSNETNLNINLKPIRVPSRLGLSSRPGSAGSTPRHAGTPKPGKYRRRRFLYLLQIILLCSVGLLVFKQAASFGSSSNSGGSAPVRKRQLISSQADEWHNSQQIAISQQGDDRNERLQALAEALLAENGHAEVSMHPGDSPVSEVFAHPTTGPAGNKVSYYYRFTNVRLSDGGIDVFAGPERVQPQESVFDLVAVNSSTTHPPTSILLGASGVEGSTSRSIPVRYLAQQRPSAACSQWIEEPSLFLHSRFPENMWHTYTEGLIPAFQTLRELGYLSLMEVSPEGAVREVTEGVPAKQCPQVAVTATGAVMQATDCLQKTGVGSGAPVSCELGNQTWCIPGVWQHTASAPGKRPGIVYFEEKTLDNEWGSLYSAMTGSIRSFDSIQGACFRNLIIGTSRTLNVAESLPNGGEAGESHERLKAMADALEIFRRFVRSAQHRLKVNNAIEFLGYTDFYQEKMRIGIEYGKSHILDHAFDEPLIVRPDGGATAPVLEDWEEIKQQDWILGTQRQSVTTKNMIASVIAQAAKQIQPSPIRRPTDYETESPLPVVTYITRWNDLNRAILNERQVLRYIYWKYNCTIKVTNLSEHVDAVADLLEKTDVLIGAHGAGWAHAMFLKPGATTLQLLPYGWRRSDGGLLRGGQVKTLAQLRRGTHLEWVNPHARYSFFRRQDFSADPEDFRRHPEENGGTREWSLPRSDTPHPAWLNANTYADLNHLGPYIDEVMRAAGVAEMDPEIIAMLREEKLQKQLAKLDRAKRLGADASQIDEEEEDQTLVQSTDDENVATTAKIGTNNVVRNSVNESFDDNDAVVSTSSIRNKDTEVVSSNSQQSPDDYAENISNDYAIDDEEMAAAANDDDDTLEDYVYEAAQDET